MTNELTESLKDVHEILGRAQEVIDRTDNVIDCAGNTVNETVIGLINAYIRELSEARDDLVLDYIGTLVKDKFKDFTDDEEHM